MEGVGEVLAGDERLWKQNEQGKWYAVGHAVPHQLRAAVIQLKEESEADKAAGRRGKTWQQIADAAGGPTMRTCKKIWERYDETGAVAAKPSVPNASTKLGTLEVEFLVDKYHQDPAYQLSDYCRLLREEIGVHVAESTVCRVFKDLRLTLKDPDVARRERFCDAAGNVDPEKVRSTTHPRKQRLPRFPTWTRRHRATVPR